MAAFSQSSRAGGRSSSSTSRRPVSLRAYERKRAERTRSTTRASDNSCKCSEAVITAISAAAAASPTVYAVRNPSRIRARLRPTSRVNAVGAPHRSACCSFASRLPGCQQGTAWVAAPMFDQRAAAHLACGRGLICSHSTRPERKHVCASLAVGWALAAAAAPLSEIAGTAARRRCRAVSRLESVSSCSRVASAGG